MKTYVKFLLVSYFLFFQVYKHDFIRCVDFIRILQPETQQVMTSQMRSVTILRLLSRPSCVSSKETPLSGQRTFPTSLLVKEVP